MKRFYALLAAGVCLAASVPAVSATITKIVTIDLTGASISGTPGNGMGLLVAGSTFAPISIASGDTLDYTINFSGTQAITVTEADSFYARLRAVSGASSTNVSGSGTLTLFTSPSISSLATSYSYVSSDSAGQILDAVAAFDPTLPRDVTFTGVRYVGTVNYTTPGVPIRDYNLPSFQVAGETVTVSGAAAAVPEPASWALMVVGFGVVGGALRRRTVRASTQLNFR